MISMWMAAAPNYGRRREDAIASEDVEIDLGVDRLVVAMPEILNTVLRAIVFGLPWAIGIVAIGVWSAFRFRR